MPNELLSVGRHELSKRSLLRHFATIGALPSSDFVVGLSKASRFRGNIYSQQELGSSLIWNKKYGGMKPWYIYSVLQSQNGGYVLCGVSGGFVEGEDKALLIKTDSQGNQEWVKEYRSIDNPDSRNVDPSALNSSAVSVVQADDDGYVFCGTADDPDDPVRRRGMLVVKTDDSGEKEWSRTFVRTGSDVPASLVKAVDGGYIALGQTLNQAWLVKVDEAGNRVWTRTIGESRWNSPTSIIQTEDGGYAFAGSTEISGESENLQGLWLVKVDAGGQQQWSQSYGQIGSGGGVDLVQTKSGQYVLCGNFENSDQGVTDVRVVKTDSEGSEQWTQTFGGDRNQIAYSIVQAGRRGFLFCGETFPSLNAWFVRLDGSGTKVWEETVDVSHRDRATSVIRISEDQYVFGGVARQIEMPQPGLPPVSLINYAWLGEIHETREGSQAVEL